MGETRAKLTLTGLFNKKALKVDALVDTGATFQLSGGIGEVIASR